VGSNPTLLYMKRLIVAVVIVAVVILAGIIWFAWSRPGVEIGSGIVVEKLHTPSSSNTGIGMTTGSNPQPTVVVVSKSEQMCLVVKVGDRHLVQEVDKDLYYGVEIGQPVHIRQFWWGYRLHK
jgi:hypothetical protein